MKQFLLSMIVVVSAYCSEEINVDSSPKPGASVSMCVFTSTNDSAEVFLFKKVTRSYWFKNGSLNTKEEYAYKTKNGYCVYPSGKVNKDKNPGSLVFPCGASYLNESIKAAAIREFEEETGYKMAERPGDKDHKVNYKAFSLKDDQGAFYVLCCHITPIMKDELQSILMRNFEERDAFRLSPPPQHTDFNPKIADDELESFCLMDLRGSDSSIETSCQRSSLIYQHLVKEQRKRSRPTRVLVPNAFVNE